MQNPFQEITERLSRIEDYLISLSPTPQLGENAKDVGNIQIAVDETGLSTHSIYRLACERKIPHSKKGGRLYFSRKAIRKWIEEGNRPAMA